MEIAFSRVGKMKCRLFLWTALCMYGFTPVISFSQATIQSQLAKSSRQKININQDWRFKIDNHTADFKKLSNSGWQQVTVPHAFSLSKTNIYLEDNKNQEKFQRDIGWYRKTLSINSPKGSKVFLEFEGAHQVTDCWVNGKFAGRNDISGYTPFSFDITQLIVEGKQNEVLLKVDNTLNKEVPLDGEKADFIKYGGLYRNVYLVVTNPLHITFPWEDRNAGVEITTPSVSLQNATVSVKTTVRNETSANMPATVVMRIIDAGGLVVAKKEMTADIKQNQDKTFYQTTGIEENLHLWSIESPYLYRVSTSVYSGSQLVDYMENPLGIRKFEFVDGKGFLLNGKPVELIGANRHQHYPYIGNAVPETLHWKDAKQLKEAGFNVVRLAHYPHNNAFIDACDQLGILVYEEPPTWIHIGPKMWMDRLEQSLRIMIRNHRNHPSILMWQAGINHRGPVEQLQYAAKEEDPIRLTASNGSQWTGPRNSGVTDLYTPMDYEGLPLPEGEFMFLCEHGSSPDAERNQLEVSKTRQAPNRIGAAVWSAHEYVAFEKNRLKDLRYIFSIYRVPHPVMRWYQSEMLQTPVIYIADERISKNGVVKVFSNAQQVALYHDGKLIEQRYPDVEPGKEFLLHPTFTFKHIWTAGTLVAKGINIGKVMDSTSITMAGKAAKITVEIPQHEIPFKANGYDMLMVNATIQDADGNTAFSDTATKITFEVEGAGRIEGGADIGANPMVVDFGTATAILRAGTQPGIIKVIAKANGLYAGSAYITSTTYNPDVTSEKALPFYELKQEKVDIGKAGEELVQFGWERWIGTGNADLRYQFKHFPASAVISSADAAGIQWQSVFGVSGEELLHYRGWNICSWKKSSIDFNWTYGGKL